MSRCPTQDWERYVAACELPELCPVCGQDNADPETGEWLSVAAPFCSPVCQEVYIAEQRKLDDAYAEESSRE